MQVGGIGLTSEYDFGCRTSAESYQRPAISDQEARESSSFPKWEGMWGETGEGREILRLRGPTRHSSARKRKSGRSAQDDKGERAGEKPGETQEPFRRPATTQEREDRSSPPPPFAAQGKKAACPFGLGKGRKLLHRRRSCLGAVQ